MWDIGERGTGLSALVNEIKLNDIVGLYERLGSGNLKRVLIAFYSQDWPWPLEEESIVPLNLSVNMDNNLSVRFSTVGVEYWGESDGSIVA